jgi:hypothetical protein
VCPNTRAIKRAHSEGEKLQVSTKISTVSTIVKLCLLRPISAVYLVDLVNLSSNAGTYRYLLHGNGTTYYLGQLSPGRSGAPSDGGALDKSGARGVVQGLGISHVAAKGRARGQPSIVMSGYEPLGREGAGNYGVVHAAPATTMKP